MKEEYYYLGKITKLFGLKGELIFFLDVDSSSEYESLNGVYIELNGDKVPFLIDKIKVRSRNSAIVKLAYIKSTDEAQKFINKALYLPISTLPKLKGKQFYYHEIIGFTAVCTKEGDVGEIVDVNDQTAQALLIIHKGKNEILFPVVDDLIDRIDRKGKKLFLNFPEGLLDLYR